MQNVGADAGLNLGAQMLTLLILLDSQSDFLILPKILIIL